MKLPILTFKGWMKDHVTNIIVFVCFPVLSAPHAPTPPPQYSAISIFTLVVEKIGLKE